MSEGDVIGLTERENAAVLRVAHYIPPNDDWDAFEEVRWLLAELVQRRADDHGVHQAAVPPPDSTLPIGAA